MDLFENNKKIIEIFKKLLIKLSIDKETALSDGNESLANDFNFKYVSFERAIHIIENLDFEITSADQLKGVKWIGTGIRDRIKQILSTGTIDDLNDKESNIEKKVDNVSENSEKIGILELMSIDGIGFSKAKQYYDMGITSISKLKKAIKSGKVSVENNHQMNLGLKYYGLLQQKIPRNETKEIFKYISKIKKSLNIKKSKLKVCGSYRRKRPFSNDIDIIFCSDKINNFDKLIEKLMDNKFILDAIYPKYNTKFLGYCQLSTDNNDDHVYPVRRIDIIYSSIQNYGANLLYFTGPKEFNTYMRKIAKNKNLKLNEHYLVDRNNDKPIITETEKDIFDILDMKYLTPKERDEFVQKK